MGMLIVATAAAEQRRISRTTYSARSPRQRSRQRVQDDDPLQCLDALLDASHHDAARV